jgi:hypothetical protein
MEDAGSNPVRGAKKVKIPIDNELQITYITFVTKKGD